MVEIFQIVFILLVFSVALIGFIKAATKDDDQK